MCHWHIRFFYCPYPFLVFPYSYFFLSLVSAKFLNFEKYFSKFQKIFLKLEKIF